MSKDLAVPSSPNKKNKAKAYVSISKDKYFQSELFGKVIAYIQKHPGQCSFKEHKDKMILTFTGVGTIEDGLKILSEIK